MLWVITYTHFEHHAMIKSCNRPEDFTDRICENWEKMVAPTDRVLHLGDCAWGPKAMERLVSLPGKKFLIRGNHDDKSDERYMEMGWDGVFESVIIKRFGVRILFSHKPRWDHKADINIHGHFHDLHREDFSRLYLPLSLESMGYRPIALDRDFMGPITSWVGKKRIPKLKEIVALRQNHRPLCERDMYGRQGRERFMEEFRGHYAIDHPGEYLTDMDIDTMLEKHGISEAAIRDIPILEE